MKWLLLLLLVLHTLNLPAQVIKLNNKDQLIGAPSVINVRDTDNVKIDLTYLDKWNLQVIQETKKLLADNINASLETLTDSSNRKFYAAICDSMTCATIINDLTRIGKALNLKVYHSSLSSTSSFYHLDTLLRYLLRPSNKYYVIEKDFFLNYLSVGNCR